MIKMNWVLTAEEQKHVEKNLGLVRNVVRRFRKCYDMEQADLIQIGNIGLMSAVHHYTLRKKAGEIIDCNFATFAWTRISAHIRQTLKTRYSIKRLGIAIEEFLVQAYAVTGKKMDPTEVAILFGISDIAFRTVVAAHAGFENLDDVLESEPESLAFVDDKLSPLDQAMITEASVRKRLEKLNSLRASANKKWKLSRAVWELQ